MKKKTDNKKKSPVQTVLYITMKKSDCYDNI